MQMKNDDGFDDAREDIRHDEAMHDDTMWEQQTPGEKMNKNNQAEGENTLSPASITLTGIDDGTGDFFIAGSPQHILLALNVASLGLWTYNFETRQAEVNDRFRAIYGFAEDEPLTAERVIETIHPDDVEWVVNRRIEMYRPDVPVNRFHDVYRIYRQDGELRWIEVSSEVFFHDVDGKQEPVRSIGIITDVTERMETQEALRKSEEKYRSLFNSIDQAFAFCEMIVDEEGNGIDYRILEANHAFEKMAGIPIDHAVTRTYRQLRDEINEEWMKRVSDTALNGVTHRFEHYDPTTESWYDTSMIPRGVNCFALLCSNITKRKSIEGALRRSRAKLAEEVSALKLLHTMTNEVVTAPSLQNALATVLDASIELVGADIGNIQLYNPDREGLEIVVQKGFGTAYLDAFEIIRSAHSSACARAMRTGRQTVIEDVEVDKEYAPYRHIARIEGYRAVQATPLIGHNGSFLGIISTHFSHPTTLSKRDLRLLDLLGKQAAHLIEHLQNEEALVQMNNSLEERVAERTGQLRDMASHLTRAEQEERRRISQILHDDLQQLLYGIEMQMSMLEDLNATEEDLERCREIVQDVTSWTNRAIRTTRRLTVDLSPPVLRGEGLTDALGWLVSQMKELYNFSVTVQADHAFNLADADMRVLLFQIVRELLFNVVKHGKTSEAEVTIEESGDEMKITVCDRGCGFDMTSLNERKEEGGFGLFSIRERLGLFGGGMNIISARGEGTTVEVTAPFVPVG